MTELELINDEDFAQKWIESRNRTRPKSVRSLKMELAIKGVPKETIESAVESLSTEDEIELAKRAIIKHVGAKREIPSDPIELDAYNKKLIGFLQRRGFGWSVIKTAMQTDLIENCDED
jgi:regulatory protein